MARTRHLVELLKLELRNQGIRYRDLADNLEVSESTIKHMFSSGNFSLKRLDKICEILGLEVTDLVERHAKKTVRIDRLSIEHERILISDMKLLTVAYSIVNHWTVDDILAKYAISETECISALAQLDR
ncbi:MAG: helix-turn-helix transcriptional regulator, partial [Pseudomonadota bacterium]